MQPDTLWTIGHSTLPLESFRDLLLGEKIEVLADVRRYPASKRYPHFNADALRGSLAANAILYEGFPDLGGRRSPRADSVNIRWRNASFRGYADYMETEPFEAALTRLTSIAAHARTAIMCAEAPWWRCHRALIADRLKAGGIDVLHIMGRGAVVAHPYTSAASVVDGTLRYGPGRGLFG